MREDNDLWQRVYEGFAYQGDPTPQIGLNRIAAKCLQLKTTQSFDCSNCTVREVFLPLHEISQFDRHHERDRPRRESGSIVVLSYSGKHYVLDGHNRISKWIKDGSTELRSVLLIEPKPSLA